MWFLFIVVCFLSSFLMLVVLIYMLENWDVRSVTLGTLALIALFALFFIGLFLIEF